MKYIDDVFYGMIYGRIPSTVSLKIDPCSNQKVYIDQRPIYRVQTYTTMLINVQRIGDRWDRW